MNLAASSPTPPQRDPEHVAIKLDDAELTYAQLDGASAHVARPAARPRASSPATASGSCSPTSRTSPSCYYGVLRAGGVVVPMNVLLKRREVAFYLRDPGPSCCSPGTASPRTPQAGAEEAGAECMLVKPGEFEQLLAAAEPIARGGRRAPTTTRR